MSESLINITNGNLSPYMDFFDRICPDDNVNIIININNTIDTNEIKTESDNIHNTEDQNTNRNDLTNEDNGNNTIGQNNEVNENTEQRFNIRNIRNYTDGITHYARRLNFDGCIDENMDRNQDLNSLTLVGLSEVQQLVDKDECCSICLKNYETNLSTSNVCKLGCSHHFHTNCLSQWMASHHTCPLCRTQFCPIFL